MNAESTPSIRSGTSAGIPPNHRSKFNFWRWFWLSTIPVSGVWVWFDFYVPPNHIAWVRDCATAKQQAAQSGKPLILFFTGEWCVPCRIMKRTVWADEQVESVVQAGFTPVMIDVDDPKEAETVRHFGVYATPTTMVVDPRGELLNRAQRGMNKTEFLEFLKKPKAVGNPSSIPGIK